MLSRVNFEAGIPTLWMCLCIFKGSRLVLCLKGLTFSSIFMKLPNLCWRHLNYYRCCQVFVYVSLAFLHLSGVGLYIDNYWKHELMPLHNWAVCPFQSTLFSVSNQYNSWIQSKCNLVLCWYSRLLIITLWLLWFV